MIHITFIRIKELSVTFDGIETRRVRKQSYHNLLASIICQPPLYQLLQNRWWRQMVGCETEVDCTKHTTDHHRCIITHRNDKNKQGGQRRQQWLKEPFNSEIGSQGRKKEKTLLWLDLYSAGSCNLWPLWVLRQCTVYNDHEKKKNYWNLYY